MHPATRAFQYLRGAVERFSGELAACAFAIAWFFYLGYGPTLRATHIAWMLRGDWAAYFWGFTFFRNAAWSWPLGNTPELFWPHGTSVGFTDANPWLAVVFKLLSPVLPADFQFSGMWFLLCFVLYALAGARLGAVLTEDNVLRGLSGMLFAVSALLPSRNGHIALCAFFFVAIGVLLNLTPVRTRADGLRLVRHACLWLAWAAGTHAYLSVMLLALCIAACVRLAAVLRVLRGVEALLAVGACVAVTLAVYWLFGFIGWRQTDLTAKGFGEFSGDLTALINPMSWSRIVPGIRVNGRQWEGFSYLGLGVLGLLALRIALSARAPAAALRGLRAHWPLAMAVLAMWLYSWSSLIAFRGETVLDLTALYAPLESLTGIFRSSGRFSWPLHVVLVVVALSSVAALKNRWIARALLFAAVALQGAELKTSELDFKDVALHPLRHAAWAESADAYAHLALVPLNLLWVCRYDHALVNRLSYEAYRRHWSFNSGNFMRKPPGTSALCNAPVDLSLDTIYVATGRPPRALTQGGYECGRLDGLIVCVTRERPTALLTAVREHRL